MTVKPLVFGALAAACVTAAAGGAYVAVRQNPSADPAPVSEQTAGPASSGASSPAPVTETEGVVTPPAAAPAARGIPGPAPERAPKKDTPARQAPPLARVEVGGRAAQPGTGCTVTP